MQIVRFGDMAMKAIVVCMLFFLQGANDCEAAVTEGPAPTIALPSLEGKPLSLTALRGQVVIVHFWATWCPGCREEMPVLDDFYQRHHAQGLEIIAVSLDKPHAKDKATEYMRAFHFPAGMVSEASENDFGTPSALPITYVIDRQGGVAAIWTPDKTKLTADTLDKTIQPLLAP